MKYDAAYLPLVIEEAAEIIQAATKIMRFGLNDINPNSFNENKTNLEDLANEVGDFLEVVERLGLPQKFINDGQEMKKERLEEYGPHGTYLKEPMSNETCSAGCGVCKQELLVEPYCPVHKVLGPHYVCGTPIGHECGEAPQPEKVEGLGDIFECMICEQDSFVDSIGAVCEACYQDTIRAKDEEIEKMRESALVWANSSRIRLEHAESAEARVTELEAENEGLKFRIILADRYLALGSPSGATEHLREALTPKEKS